MYLKSIELAGFKSFAKKSRLEFDAPVVAVVGPNGSGKSNVAEAFRFVLGEQSMKSMRGRRGEDLIWNGSDDAPRAGRANVKITFDNSAKNFNLDFDEVAVERVVNRDGTNEYLLNGSSVRLRDILETLSGAKIGASGHHIISQGEADRILNANPTERRSHIEDSLGLRIYQYKRQESEKKLAETSENISRVESLRRELAPHLRFLKKQVEKYEQAETEKVRLIELSRAYFASERSRLNEEKTLITKAEEPLNARFDKLHRELDVAKAALSKEAVSHDRESQGLKLEKELSEVRSRSSVLMRELGKIEGELAAERRVIEREAKSEQDRIIRLAEIEELYEEISQMSFVEKIRERIKEFINERKRVNGSVVAKEAEDRLAELNKAKSDLEKELHTANTQEKSLTHQYEVLKREIDRAKDTGLEAEKALLTLMAEENELEGKRKELEARKFKFKEEEAELMREVEEISRLIGPENLQLSAHGQKINIQDAKREITRLKIHLEDAGLSGAGEIFKEYEETNDRDEFLSRELIDLEKSSQALKELIKELEDRLTHEFKTGLEKINKEFSKFFSDLFDGGEAGLVLTKGEEEEAEGLDIKVNLPRKKIRSLMMLSGGERALTSIALIFAVSQVNPPPFIILDETDAALDEANSKKYGDMIERLAKRSQLILITHNRETMSRAGTIYGVTMGSGGASKLLSISFTEAAAVAK